MKKSTVRITIAIFVLIVGVVGYFAYLSQKSRKASEEAALTEAQRIISHDLQREYPPTPKEVVRFFTRIQKCLYSDDCTVEDMENLGMKARELFDDELLAINEVEDYIPRLKSEIETFHAEDKKITSISVPSSMDVDQFSEDNYDFARLYCRYSVIEKGNSGQVQIVFLLRRDENDKRRWKIYGWKRADDVEISADTAASEE